LLYPINTTSRTVTDLSGLWDFKVDPEDGNTKPGETLTDPLRVSVPASFNDQIVNHAIREHVGYFWYQTEFEVPRVLQDERQVLRFGSATHEAWVYLNGEEIGHHKGGFTPFEIDITKNVQSGKNILTVYLSNMLDHTTLPVGNYSEEKDEDGNIHREVDENFDFYNYAGIHRPVKLFTTPKSYIEDITIVSELNDDLSQADVKFDVETAGEKHDEIQIEIIDESNQLVTSGTDSNLKIDDVHLWQPLNAYLYTARVSLKKDGKVVDVYEEPFGIRKVEVKDGRFYINNESFYFKGFGKHEDSYIHGRGLDHALNVLDVNLMKKMGANSLRTSHYPYSDEMMRLCDREGIVVIDETTAVGIMNSFNFDIGAMLKDDFDDDTFDVIHTQEAHEQVIRELIKRDKNYASVVMWSVANEAATYSQPSRAYFEPLFELTRELDPQDRPITVIQVQMSNPDTEKVTDLVDVIALNRYYGWYLNVGDLEKGEKDTRKELLQWQEKYPDKPIMYTEYGADTVAGYHSASSQPFTEEFQEDYYEMNHKVFDEMDNFVGEQLWNFADFATKKGINRVQGNKKGVFTRQREPKMVVRSLSERWNSIPNFGYKK